MSSLSSIFRPSGGGGGGSMAGLIFIQSQTVSSATSVQFTTGITSTYNNYYISSSNVTNPNSSSNMGIQLSVDGGSTYIATGYISEAAPFEVFVIWGDNFPVSPTGNANINTWINNMTSGSGYVTGSTLLSVYDTVAGGNGDEIPSAYSVASTVVNALRITMDDDTAFSGNFHLYAYMQ